MVRPFGLRNTAINETQPSRSLKKYLIKAWKMFMRLLSSEFLRTLICILWLPNVAPKAVQTGSYINNETNSATLTHTGTSAKFSRLSLNSIRAAIIIIVSISEDFSLSNIVGWFWYILHRSMTFYIGNSEGPCLIKTAFF